MTQMTPLGSMLALRDTLATLTPGPGQTLAAYTATPELLATPAAIITEGDPWLTHPGTFDPFTVVAHWEVMLVANGTGTNADDVASIMRLAQLVAQLLAEMGWQVQTVSGLLPVTHAGATFLGCRFTLSDHDVTIKEQTT